MILRTARSDQELARCARSFSQGGEESSPMMAKENAMKLETIA
jgi:hypothetical protein